MVEMAWTVPRRARAAREGSLMVASQVQTLNFGCWTLAMAGCVDLQQGQNMRRKPTVDERYLWVTNLVVVVVVLVFGWC